MKYFITRKVLGYIARKLDGYKTIIGGVGSILLGLAGAIGYFFPDQNLMRMDFDEAAGWIIGGFTVLGLGGKLEKARPGGAP